MLLALLDEMSLQRSVLRKKHGCDTHDRPLEPQPCSWSVYKVIDGRYGESDLNNVQKNAGSKVCNELSTGDRGSEKEVIHELKMRD